MAWFFLRRARSVDTMHQPVGWSQGFTHLARADRPQRQVGNVAKVRSWNTATTRPHTQPLAVRPGEDDSLAPGSSGTALTGRPEFFRFRQGSRSCPGIHEKPV